MEYSLRWAGRVLCLVSLWLPACVRLQAQDWLETFLPFFLFLKHFLYLYFLPFLLLQSHWYFHIWCSTSQACFVHFLQIVAVRVLSSSDGERVVAWSLWDFDYFIFVLSGSNLFLFSFILQPNSPQYLLPLVWIPLGFVLIESVSLIFSFLSVSASIHTWSHSFLCFPEWAIIHPFAFCLCKMLLNSGVTLSHYVWPYSILSFICILAAPWGVWNLT